MKLQLNERIFTLNRDASSTNEKELIFITSIPVAYVLGLCALDDDGDDEEVHLQYILLYSCQSVLWQTSSNQKCK